MYSFLLQDWVTIQGISSPGPPPTIPFTQSERGWLDVSAFVDLVSFLEVDEASSGVGTIAMGIQTSPTKDDALFQNMNDVSVPIASGITVGVLLRDTALCPLSHWLRWQIIPTVPGSTTWHATFRIWVSANAPGGIARSAERVRDMEEGTGAGPAWIVLNALTAANKPPIENAPLPQKFKFNMGK
jgi:hypothetical protein